VIIQPQQFPLALVNAQPIVCEVAQHGSSHSRAIAQRIGAVIEIESPDDGIIHPID
jgi:hypothetical protein